MTNENGTRVDTDSPALTIESMIRKELHARAEAAAKEIEAIAASIRASAVDFDRVGLGGTKTYVSVAIEISSELTTRIAQLRIDRLAAAAVDADLDRARRGVV